MLKSRRGIHLPLHQLFLKPIASDLAQTLHPYVIPTAKKNTLKYYHHHKNINTKFKQISERWHFYASVKLIREMQKYLTSRRRRASHGVRIVLQKEKVYWERVLCVCERTVWEEWGMTLNFNWNILFVCIYIFWRGIVIGISYYRKFLISPSKYIDISIEPFLITIFFFARFVIRLDS